VDRLEQVNDADTSRSRFDLIKEPRKRRLRILIPAHADHQHVPRWVPDGFRRMDKKSSGAREIGVGKGAPFHVHLEKPGIIHDVANEDQVFSPEVGGLERASATKGNGPSALLG
jgi:hypothetical protein